MTSINTNTSSMAALQTLRGIGASLNTTQDQVSTGLRVGAAKDNAAYWSISTTMKSNNGAVSAAVDAVGLAKGVVDTAYAAMQTVLDAFNKVKDLVITASQTAVPPVTYQVNPDTPDPVYDGSASAQINTQVNDLLHEARTAIESASFSGMNILYNPKGGDDVASKTNTFVVGFSQGKVQTLDVPALDTMMINDNFGSGYTTPFAENPQQALLDGSPVYSATGAIHPFEMDMFNITIGYSDTADIQNANIIRGAEAYSQHYGYDREDVYNQVQQVIENKIAGITSTMSYIGSLSSALDGYETAGQKQLDTAKSGVGKLIDADMEEASTRLSALQTQQQLAVQSLSISNAAPSNILKLFQN